MFEIPFSDFVRRALKTQERITFSQIDAYGHLATAQYVNVFFDHRIQVVEDRLGVDLAEMLAVRKIAFFLKDIRYQFGIPSKMGDAIEVASWVERYSDRDMDLRCIIVGQADRLVRASTTATFVCVNLETGKRTQTPPTWTSNSDRNLALEQPTSVEYLATVRNPPAEWTDGGRVMPA